MADEQAPVEQQNLTADQAGDSVLNMLFGDQKPIEGEAIPPGKDAAPAEEMDYLEFPPDTEGGEARRVPLDEVIGGYTKAQTLEQELQAARAEFAKSGLMPRDAEQAMQETLAQRQALEHTMTIWLQQMVPNKPDVALRDPNSDKYDPQAYLEQLAAWEKGVTNYRAAREKLEENRSAMDREQMALIRSNAIRQQQELLQKWPEVTKPETIEGVMNYAKSIGFTEQEVRSTVDHRMFLVLKDAMAFRALDAQQKAAVKAVTAKPKLIRSSANNGASRNQANGQFASQAFGRLQNGGTELDGADAYMALINRK